MKPLLWDALNPVTGTPFTWDDPNLRWGDPSTYLEPGDPGYTPYPQALTPKPNQKTKRMKRQSYYPSRTADQIIWLGNFALKLAGHAIAIGVSPALCAAAIADARWLIYVLGSWLPAARAWNKACTDAAAESASGASGILMVLPVFTPPALPAAAGGNPAVVPVLTGALDRLFKLVADIKNDNGFTETIGTDLGVIGSTAVGPDMDTVQPVFEVKRSGNHIVIPWDFGGFASFLDMLKIEVNRGQGWQLLTLDSTPGYTDNTPFPATPAEWQYRAIFILDDEEVGQWSAVQKILVGG